MALPQSLRVSVTPPELELISCQQLVEVVPLISMEKTAFISVYFPSQTLPNKSIDPVCQGAYGPLRPPNKAKIPLWMAVNLKLKKKCHIVAPDWLNVGAFVTKKFAFSIFVESLL
jgi:GINS complex subunit 2